MSDTDYHNQRCLGAQEITAMAHEMALEAGLTDVNCEWDHGYPMTERDTHSLKITSGKSSCEGTFSDEELADFPGKAGTERTKAKISAIIRTLKTENAL